MKTTDACDRMALFRQSFGTLAHKGLSPDYYRWKSTQNPFGTGHICLVPKGEAIAGCASVTPKRISVRGSDCLAFEIGDTYTNPQYRRQGVFLEAVSECVDFAEQSDCGFIYGTPNDASLPGYVTKANFAEVPDLRIALLTKYISREAIASRIRAKLRIAFIGSAVADLLLLANRIRVRSALMRRMRFKPLEQGGAESLDGMWGDRSAYAFFTTRDRKFLEWRYLRNPDTYSVVLGDLDGKPTGLLVTKCFEREGMKVGAICDVVALDDAAAIVTALVAKAESDLRAAGCGRIEAWCSSRSPNHGNLIALGYRELTAFPVIINRGCKFEAQLLEGGGKWHFMYADSDNM